MLIFTTLTFAGGVVEQLQKVKREKQKPSYPSDIIGTRIFPENNWPESKNIKLFPRKKIASKEFFWSRNLENKIAGTLKF